MTQPSSETISLAAQLLEAQAGDGLQPSFAKLYSQHSRLRAGQPGLSKWRENEASNRLDDVVRLIEAAFIQKEAGNDNQWRRGMRRAGELLEWLSHLELNPEQLPIHLIATAAYQLAGYPARASGLLRENTTETVESEILRSLLKADFPTLLQRLTEYWSEAILNSEIEEDSPSDKSNIISAKLQQLIVRETASSLGILCATMRWGYEPRLQKAINKLSTVEKLLLHDYKPYSWLLAKLCAEVVKVYVETSLRHHLERLSQNVSQTGQDILERYIRRSYQSCRILAWLSQIRGIEQLITEQSFALCTPTGSGKTTVAELAILQSLFLETNRSDRLNSPAPIVLYLVPSRALATEVENKLSIVLSCLTSSNQQVIVTGLYGGTDWGPTDTWLTSEERTILICTYEKAEALIKFLGNFFLSRVSLVVLDEAHSVQFDGNKNSLQVAENRNLRLESLGTRLFTYLSRNPKSRIIALSAVASELENALASWIAGKPNENPTKVFYKSTRQLIGRLECLPNRKFKICYDLLDGTNLEFEGSEEEGNPKTPFIPNPFSEYPWAGKLETDDSFEKRLRPYLFWAAMNLAASESKTQKYAVLISVMQYIGGYAEDFLWLLNNPWRDINKPQFFKSPSDNSKQEMWRKCLNSCKDYFGTQSREYQLLEKGIVVHHGKMPGLMSRLLIKVIEERIIHLVLATSTLSEGINLPFETVLIPSLQRWSGNRLKELNPREFGNLVGRAGRPGFGTEGRSLVLLHGGQVTQQQIREKRRQYFSLIRNLQEREESNENSNPISPLAELLIDLQKKWQQISDSNSLEEFFNWLEYTAPINEEINDANVTLDTLDNILLASIVEIEQLEGQNLSFNDLEEQLRRIWQRSYAYYANQQQKQLQEIFIRRGKALKAHIYPDLSRRRRLYKTSLPPRSGDQLLKLFPKIKEYLTSGRDYINWSSNKRINYIQAVIIDITSISKFQLTNIKGDVDWQQIIHWWLAPRHAARQPTRTQISDWHQYISQNFQYRFNWGLGSIIALAIDEAFNGEILEPSLEYWSQSGLPWIVFWMKELIVWGTLDPVAAYLLARVEEITTRNQAEELAQTYYQSEVVQTQSPNEQLNAQSIRNWVQQSFSNLNQHESRLKPAGQILIELLRDFSHAPSQEWKVVPVERNNEIYWLDPAGFPLAKCQKPENWQQSHYLNKYDFILNASRRTISSKIYL